MSSQTAARCEVGEPFNVNRSSLRNWFRRDVDEGVTPPKAQLRTANNVLRTASASSPAAELDRRLGQRSTGSNHCIPSAPSTGVFVTSDKEAHQVQIIAPTVGQSLRVGPGVGEWRD